MKRTALKTKKTSRKTLVSKLDKLVSEIVRARDKCCVVCGETRTLQAGHVFTRTAYSTRWDLLNIHAQCSGCNFRHNGNAYPYLTWFEKKFGKEALEQLHIKHRTITKFKDYQLEELLRKAAKRTGSQYFVAKLLDPMTPRKGMRRPLGGNQ